jgi:phosphoglycolate phosphatase-like HAD superfamily hydrolase
MISMNKFKIVFWDFDGVIKDSVNVKTEAFIDIFKEFGTELTQKVKEHHISNGGMSRFEKIPLYARWAGKELNDEEINNYSKKFSEIALQKVIDSNWVLGVEEVLRKNPFGQKFILVSATPEKELLFILKELDLYDCFVSVYGSPMPKKTAIERSINEFSAKIEECIMIGDAKADLEAANANHISFLLRLHDSNQSMKEVYKGFTVQNFINYESFFTNK